MSVNRVLSLAFIILFFSVTKDTSFCSPQLSVLRSASGATFPVHRARKLDPVASGEPAKGESGDAGAADKQKNSQEESEEPAVESVSWVDSKLCLSLSVLFCLSAVLISACTIFVHSVHYNVPSQQRYVVRLLFFVPVYAVGSLLILMFINYFLYFEVLRDLWEAVVVYSFFSLILDYCGGENSCAVEIARYPGSINHTFPLPFIGRRLCLLGVCRPIQHCLTHPIPLNLAFVKNCKRCVLQFILLKPFMAIVSIIMYSVGLYHEWGFYWICLGFVYNTSVCTALYALFLFYMATRHHSQLVGRRPVRKFVAIKLVIIATWYQGFLLGLLPGFDIIHATKWNNFLLCIEMPLFAILNAIAYPISEFAPRNTSTITTINLGSSPCESPSVYGKHSQTPTERCQGSPTGSVPATDSSSYQSGWAVGLDGHWRTGLVVGDVVGAKVAEPESRLPAVVPTFGSRSVRESTADEEEGEYSGARSERRGWGVSSEDVAEKRVAVRRSESGNDAGNAQGREWDATAAGQIDETSYVSDGGGRYCEDGDGMNVTLKVSSENMRDEEVDRDVSGTCTETAVRECSEERVPTYGQGRGSSGSNGSSLDSNGVGEPRVATISYDGVKEQNGATTDSDVKHNANEVVRAEVSGCKGEAGGRLDAEETAESASSVGGSSNTQTSAGVLKGRLIGRPMQILRNAIGDRQSHEKALKNVCDAVMMTDVVTDAYYNFNAKYQSHALLIDHSSEDERAESDTETREEPADREVSNGFSEHETKEGSIVKPDTT
eukprot:GHVS01027211.1.p1 GENE.GHVS01027211.1~~GHVS01027211.1.p1  ORF type:complete len:776 (-),score=71.73 GHVS01027211.1:258-2585(-)